MGFDRLVEYYKALGYSDDDARAAARRSLGQPEEPAREPTGDRPGGFVSGLAQGVKETAASYGGGLGWALDVAGLDDVGQRLQESAARVALERPELTGAGNVGRFIGRLGSEIAGTAGVGGLGLKLASRAPSVARALSGASRVKRGAATAAASLPVDIAQAAAYRDGMVLPGFGGALAENVAMSGGFGALLPAVRPSQAGVRRAERADVRRELEEAADEFGERVSRSEARLPPEPTEIFQPGVQAPSPEETAVFGRRRLRRSEDVEGRLERASRAGRRAEEERYNLPFRTQEPGEGRVVGVEGYRTRSPQKQAGALRRIRNSRDKVDQMNRVDADNAQIAARLQEIERERTLIPSAGARRSLSPEEIARRRNIMEEAGVSRGIETGPARATDEAIEPVAGAVPETPGLIEVAEGYRPRSPERARAAQQGIRRLLSEREVAEQAEAAAAAARNRASFEQQLLESSTATRRARRQTQFEAEQARAAEGQARLEGAMEAGAREEAARRSGERGLSLYSFPGPLLQNQLAQSLTGGVIGASVGSELDEEGEYAGTLLGGIAGLAAPALTRKIMRGADKLPSLTQAVARDTEDIRVMARGGQRRSPTAYEEGLAAGTVGTPRREPEINSSTLTMDPTGDVLYGQTLEAIARSGRTVGDEEVARLAKELNIKELLGSGKVNLDTVEIAALANSIKAASKYRKQVIEALESPRAIGQETREALEAARDRATDYLTNFYYRLNLAGSEKGRGLRYLQVAAQNADDIPGYIRIAKQFLGAEKIDDRILSRIAQIYNLPKSSDQRARELVRFLSQNRDVGLLQVLSDISRWGLLTAPASFIRNFVGGTEAVTGRVVDSAITNALDKMLTGKGGVPISSMSAVPREARKYVRQIKAEQGFGASFRRQAGEELKPFLAFRDKGAKGGFEALYERFGSGINPEDPFSLHALNRAMYEAYVNKGNAEWMRSLTPAAKAFDVMRNSVYGMLAATDRPFFRASFNEDMLERAMLRALSEGVDPASDAFKATVLKYASPSSGDARPLDVFMATRRALEDTFKTPTGIGSAIRSLSRYGGAPVQAAGEFLIPFANTPTNIVRKALERVPVLGQAIGSVRAANLENKLVQMRRKLEGLRAAGVRELSPSQMISAEDIQREVAKFRREVFARQVTGTAMIGIGYILHKSGLLTPEYVPAMGASGAEAEEIQRQRLTNSGPVALNIMGNSLNIASLGISAPLLALGAAISQADESEEPVGVTDKFAIGLRSAARTAQSMPLLRGLEDIRALSGGQIDVGEYAGRQARRFVPASAAVGAVSRVLDPEVGKREPEGFLETFAEGLPGLRGTLPARVSPLGEVAEAPNPLLALFSPFTPKRTLQGPLYDILEELQLYPSPARRMEGETEREYSERRQAEGVEERAAIMQAYQSATELGLTDEATLAESPEARERLRKYIERALRRVRSRASRLRARQLTGEAG